MIAEKKAEAKQCESKFLYRKYFLNFIIIFFTKLHSDNEYTKKIGLLSHLDDRLVICYNRKVKEEEWLPFKK